MDRFRGVLLSCVALMISNCSSHLVVEDISKGVDVNSSVNGIPFRVLQPYRLTVYQKTEKGYVEKKVIRKNLPDTDRLYTINFDSEFFSNHTTDIQFNLDGTLKFVKLIGESQADEALSTLGQQIESVTGKVVELETAKEAASTAKEGELTTDEDALLAALLADQEVQKAQLTLDSLGPKAEGATLLAAQQTLEAAKLKANITNRRAGRSFRYPGVFE